MLKKKAPRKTAKRSARRPARKTVHKKGKRRTTKGEWSVSQALAGFAGKDAKKSVQRYEKSRWKREGDRGWKKASVRRFLNKEIDT